MTGVQIIGKEAVLNRFEKFDTEAWALFQGKQFVVSGSGDESLADWLNDLSSCGSTATYTLRVYDGTVPTSATANSGYIASLNFKLVDMYEGQGIAGHTTRLMQRIEGLEKKLETSEQEPETEDLNDVLMGWLSDPEKLGMVVGAFRQFMGYPVPPMQTVAGVSTPAMPSGAGGATAEDKLTRIAGALDELEKHDPALDAHLEKLAKLAKEDPLIFKAVISKLDAL